MKILQLRAENVKRLKAVEITPDGNTVLISGKNAQGKTSVLDSIYMALAGAAGKKHVANPVRDGEDHAEVTVDLGQYLVTRTWSADGRSALRVTNAEGFKASSPQAMLDELLGELSFDPLAFSAQRPKDQVETLLGLIDLPFDPDKLDADRAEAYEARTILNRQVKEYEGRLAGLAVDGDPQPVDTEALVAELDEAARVQRIHDQAHNDYAVAIDALNAADVAVLAALEAQKAAQARVDAASAALEVLPDLIDPEPIREKLRGADEVNALVRRRREYDSVADELAGLRSESKKKTDLIDMLDKTKADALAAAKLPIKGLGFTADGVTYQGVPFRDCSAAEQLRVSVAMAMAMNPTIRVIRITDGSLLDSDNLALIEKMADDEDFQVWIEVVDDSGEIGFYIEDGMVR